MLHDEIRTVAGEPLNTLIFAYPPPEPLPAPPADHQLRQARIAELLVIPRSDWTTAQLREIIQLVAQGQI